MKIENPYGFEVWIDLGTRGGEKNTYYVCTSYEKTISHEVFKY
jgi:hypothetical protein